MAVTSIAPVDAITSWSPLVLPSSPPAVALSSPSSQLLYPTALQHSPHQTPHVHAIPSLSQSYPLDDLLDYEHGLELLSPPSPLSRTDVPFELAGLSPKPELGERSTRDQDSGAQISGVHVDSITNSTSTAYLSFSASPALCLLGLCIFSVLRTVMRTIPAEVKFRRLFQALSWDQLDSVLV